MFTGQGVNQSHKLTSYWNYRHLWELWKLEGGGREINYFSLFPYTNEILYRVCPIKNPFNQILSSQYTGSWASKSLNSNQKGITRYRDKTLCWCSSAQVLETSFKTPEGEQDTLFMTSMVDTLKKFAYRTTIV